MSRWDNQRAAPVGKLGKLQLESPQDRLSMGVRGGKGRWANGDGPTGTSNVCEGWGGPTGRTDGDRRGHPTSANGGQRGGPTGTSNGGQRGPTGTSNVRDERRATNGDIEGRGRTTSCPHSRAHTQGKRCAAQKGQERPLRRVETGRIVREVQTICGKRCCRSTPLPPTAGKGQSVCGYSE